DTALSFWLRYRSVEGLGIKGCGFGKFGPQRKGANNGEDIQGI
ncbi:unnamed protein product, partial [marine sediment metagenome]